MTAIRRVSPLLLACVVPPLAGGWRRASSPVSPGPPSLSRKPPGASTARRANSRGRSWPLGISPPPAIASGPCVVRAAPGPFAAARAAHGCAPAPSLGLPAWTSPCPPTVGGPVPGTLHTTSFGSLGRGDRSCSGSARRGLVGCSPRQSLAPGDPGARTRCCGTGDPVATPQGLAHEPTRMSSDVRVGSAWRPSSQPRSARNRHGRGFAQSRSSTIPSFGHGTRSVVRWVVSCG